MERSCFDELLSRAEHFIARLEDDFFADAVDMEAECRTGTEEVPFDRRLDGEYTPVRIGEAWGSAWDQAWFRLRATPPEAWRGRELAIRLYLSGEILLHDAAGRELCGLTNNSVFVSEFRKELYPLRPTEGPVELWARVSGTYIMGLSTETFNATIQKLTLGIFRREVWRLWNDLTVLVSLVKGLAPRRFPAQRILRCVNAVVNAYAADPANAATCSTMLASLFDAPNGHLEAWALGHSHLDTAWLWPLAETRRKAARTFSSQLDLLERYPEYLFGASTPLHYQFVKEDHPALYARVKEAVRAGRWELLGGMWIEADTNLSGGESLIRQFVYGKNFFRDEFGVEVNNCWLPDVFGYSAALPQIIRKCGCDYFLTTKLAWNKVTAFPHRIFRWRGIDGSEVFSYLPLESGYGNFMMPENLIRAEENLPENDLADNMLVLFGIGDGGGGPRDDFIERARRMASLPETPRVKFAAARDFFASLEPLREGSAVWSGELYLENHRGTFTSQAWLKRADRRLEAALCAAEMICAAVPPERYPAEPLERAWKTLLLNQFHDILPGSSIREVYDEAKQQFEAAFRDVDLAVDRAAGLLLESKEDHCVCFNALSVPCRHPFRLPEGWRGASLDGAALPVQEIAGIVRGAVEIPPLTGIGLVRADRAASAESTTGMVLKNALVRYEFDRTGRLVGAFDREAGREILAAPGNEFSLYEDTPNEYDAWNIDSCYREARLTGASEAAPAKLETGELGQVLILELAIGNSRLTQHIFLGRDARQLDFETEICWNESHRMLRTAFPCAVKNGVGSCDIQYGFLTRPLIPNTPGEAAQFECVMHRYADISNRDHGVAVLNDGKYGCMLRDNLIDIALLRSPKYPDPEADLGTHRFTYSLLPHTGELTGSEVIDAAAQLNHPPAMLVGRAGRLTPPVSVSGGGTALTVLKKAEKSGDLIVRLVEKFGRNAAVDLELRRPAALSECDMLEWRQLADYGTGREFHLTLEPFEIKTLRISS